MKTEHEERAVIKVEPGDTVDILYVHLKPEEHKAFIRVLKKNDYNDKLKLIKEQLPENITYGQIKIVLAFNKKGKA